MFDAALTWFPPRNTNKPYNSRFSLGRLRNLLQGIDMRRFRENFQFLITCSGKSYKIRYGDLAVILCNDDLSVDQRILKLNIS